MVVSRHILHLACRKSDTELMREGGCGFSLVNNWNILSPLSALSQVFSVTFVQFFLSVHAILHPQKWAECGLNSFTLLLLKM